MYVKWEAPGMPGFPLNPVKGMWPDSRRESSSLSSAAAHCFALPGPGYDIYLSGFSGVVAVMKTIHTPQVPTDAQVPKHNLARPLATVGQGDVSVTAFMLDNLLWITRSEMFSKAQLPRILIFISLSLPLRCWNCVCYVPQQGPKELEIFTKLY